jgi:hypothetical protein
MKTAGPKVLLPMVVLITAFVAPAAGQTAASSFAELEGRMPGVQKIYVYTGQAKNRRGRIKASLLHLSPAMLQMSVRGRMQEFGERDVLMISEPHSSTMKGALIGLAAGTALDLSVMHGWQLARDCRTDPESCAWAQVGFAIMAASGTFLGALIGHSIEHERILFLAPHRNESRAFTLTPVMSADRHALAATFRF